MKKPKSTPFRRKSSTKPSLLPRSSHPSEDVKRITVPWIKHHKGKGKLSAVTAYDFTMARLVDRSGIDIVLVGDSVATVLQGHQNTLPATLDHMVYHSQCVTRAVTRALVVGDLPFLSYQVSIADAVRSAGILIKDGGVSAVKLEGGVAMAETMQRLVELDIPVMGHVGLTPQSFHRMGGHKIQGKRSGRLNSSKKYSEAGTRQRILEDAQAVDEAGAFAIVLEGIPAELAAEITQIVSVPTIGIGAGPSCDGQILVLHDILGLDPEFAPRFVKRYAELGEDVIKALQQYRIEVLNGTFPSEAHTVRDPLAKQLKLAKA